MQNIGRSIKVFETQKPYLQKIIGVDKKNPAFTVWCNPEANSCIHVYFGTELMEVVPDDRNNPQFKLMIARLYLAGIKPKKLTEMFGPARTTIKRWADALAGGDPERLIQALAGPGPKRKLTVEVIAFVKMRFSQIYAENRYTYSQQIRNEIKQVFNRSISGETLRPLFGQLKTLKAKNTDNSADADKAKRANTCDLPDSQNAESDVKQEDNDNDSIDNRNNSLAFYQDQHQQLSLFCHHVGVLLFSNLLAQLWRCLGEKARMIQQWIVTILLGAVNIEQTKTLDFDSLQRLLGGQVIRSLYCQRTYLDELADQENLTELFDFNADLIDARGSTDFYYDPHTKHYTGAQKILKGWCPKIKGIGKVLHMDFIHTDKGQPVFVEHTDNFYDLRERFPKTVTAFRSMMQFNDDIPLTFIIDRGIFKIALFAELRDKLNVHIVTWEKGYKKGQWQEEHKSGEFIIQRPRNSSKDLQNYHFVFIDRPWSKDPSIRQIIVKATNPQNRTIEVSILATDKERSAIWIITAMFHRWLQENDFKYLDNHFGINEITSYAVLAYRKLQNVVEDKQVKSGTLKALEQQKSNTEKQLGRLLVKEHMTSGDSQVRCARIEALKAELNQIDDQIKANRTKVSRLEEVIQNEFHRLNTRPKSLLDSIKIIARNMFYQQLQPFRQMYDNYRDDHVILRNLSRADGFIYFGRNSVEVILCPTMQYQPQMRCYIETLLEQLNAQTPLMPDGSGRVIHFQLKKKASKLFAIQNTSKTGFY